MFGTVMMCNLDDRQKSPEQNGSSYRHPTRPGYQEIMRTTTYAERFACNSNQYNDQWPNWRIAKIIYMTAYGGRCIAQRDML